MNYQAYLDYLKSDEWLIRAETAKAIDGYRCRVCNSPVKLQVHHRTYKHLFNEPPEDLTTLCDECHEIFSKSGRMPKPFNGLDWEYIKPKLMTFKDWIKKYQGMI